MKSMVIYLEEGQLMGDSLSIILLNENNLFFIVYIHLQIQKLQMCMIFSKGFKAQSEGPKIKGEISLV